MSSGTRGRTWTLAELDRTGVYRLWFDPNHLRWEVRPVDEADGTIVTPRAGRRVGRRRAAEAGRDV